MGSENKLLITGGTGFLGAAILAQLVNSERHKDFIALVRANSPEEGLMRLRRQLKLFDLSEQQLNQIHVGNIIVGDLGNTEWHSDPRLETITHVINCAAITSFGKNPKIWEVNVDQTLKFAKRMSELVGLKRFIHVGTGMACGVQATSPVSEAYEADDIAKHLVPYTKSKAAVEKLMRETLPNLPLVVARPSIIVGHTTLGCKPSSSIFWVFRMAKAFGEFVCNYDERVDVVPVDWCASALLALAEKPVLRWNKYHLSAGSDFSCTFREIDAALSNAMGVQPSSNLRQVDFAHLASRRAEFPTLFGVLKTTLILTAIKLYGEFSLLDLLFDNTRILSEGIAPPQKFTQYIGLCYETSKNQTVSEQMIKDFE